MKWPRFFCCWAVLAMGGGAEPIPGSFQQIDGDGGGWFTGFAVHPGGRVYGRTDVGGLYRSDDHGETWTFLSGDMTSYAGLSVQGVAVAAGNVDVVYQTAGISYTASDPARGIWKSSDGGATWTQVKSGLSFSGNDEERWGGECVAIRPGNDSEVWAGSRGQGLWRSTDAGATWSQVGGSTFNGVNFTSLCLRSTEANDIWVAGSGGVWVSRDNGTSWAKTRTMDRAWQVARKADGTLFISGDENGQRRLWRVTSVDWADPAAPVWTDVWPNWLAAFQARFGWQPVNINPQVTALSDGRVAASDIFQDTAISADNGATWTFPAMATIAPHPAWERVPPPQRLTGGRNRLVEDPSQAGRWFLAGGYSPLRTDNGGASWKHITRGVGEIVTFKTAFHPSDPERVFIPMADHGAAVVTDSGASGAAGGFAGRHFPWPDDNVIMGHTVLASAGSRLIVPGNEQGSQQPRLYVSSNNGAVWSRQTFTGMTVAAGRPLVAAVASRDNADDFLVAMGGTITASEGGIYRTTDAGKTFVRATGLPSGFQMGDHFHWNVDLDADAADMAVRYAFLRGRSPAIYKSTDCGLTWSALPAQPRRNYGRLAADAKRGGHLWAGFTTGEAGFGLDVSTNGGVSWTAVAGFSRADEIDAVDGRVAVLGRRAGDSFNKIYYSSDNGATWGEITREGFRFGNAQDVAVDPWRPGTVWISTNGRSTARFTPWMPIQQWRQRHFGSPEDAGAGADGWDADGDGLDNLVEYALGTDPNDAAAFHLPEPRDVSNAEGVQLRIARASIVPDATVFFEVSSELAAWTALPVENATATELRARDAASTTLPRRFYRVKVTRP